MIKLENLHMSFETHNTFFDDETVKPLLESVMNFAQIDNSQIVHETQINELPYQKMEKDLENLLEEMEKKIHKNNINGDLVKPRLHLQILLSFPHADPHFLFR